MKIIKQIIIKEFLQLKRDKRLFGIVFLAPILQLLFLGYAANLDLDNIKVSVFDQDKSVTSRNFIESFESSGYLTVYSYTQSYNQISDEINHSKILLAIIIPDDFEKKIERKETTPLQLIFDGSDGNKTSIALGYVQGIISKFSKEIIMNVSDKSGRKISVIGSVQPEIRVWYNPELKTRNFMIPSIAGLILLVITTILMAMAIVKEREIGTLEQIIVTPIKPYQLIIGKIIPFAILGFIDILLVNAVMVFWFGIVIKGTFHINYLKDTATGNDGCTIRLNASDDLFIGICVPYRKHAAMDSVYYIPHSFKILYYDIKGYNFKRFWTDRFAAPNYNTFFHRCNYIIVECITFYETAGVI